jgi:hypothetical protein
MAGVLIRDVLDAVLAGVDAHAARLGISRVEYIRRRLAADTAHRQRTRLRSGPREFADMVPDLANDEVMDAAWRRPTG